MTCSKCGSRMVSTSQGQQLWCETCGYPKTALKLVTRNETISQETVTILKEYLALAERGEIVSVAIAALEPDGSAMHQASPTDDNVTLLGAVTRLLHRMHLNADRVTE